MTRAAQPFAVDAIEAPPVRDLSGRLHEARELRRHKLVVLDDDPTGSQSVQGVPLLTRWDDDDLRWALQQPGHAFFVLTNTRSIDARSARAVLRDVVEQAERVAGEMSIAIDFVTRSDSTLRGHFPLETDLLIERAATQGRPYSALLLVPAYLEAGRITTGDVHYVRDDDQFVPVGQTDYAQDATFGFRSSDLRDYVEEKSAGGIGASTVRSIGLDDIRVGGPERVAELILDAGDAAPIIVNATVRSDLDTVALGLLDAESRGARVLIRTGPSFIASLLGLAPGAEPGWAAGEEQDGRAGNGLVVVGSHVDLTSRQIERVRAADPGLAVIEVCVRRLLDPVARGDEILRCTRELREALDNGDVLLMSSRRRVFGASGASSLRIAHAVSDALVGLVRDAVRSSPVGWVIAKGGITSNDIATAGLGISRATVVGQLFPGLVSVWVNESISSPGLRGLPYVVFAGNVGTTESLWAAISLMRNRSARRSKAAAAESEPDRPQASPSSVGDRGASRMPA